MLFLLTNRTRPGLTGAQYGELAALAKDFYARIPAGVAVHHEWAALDQSQNFTLLEAPDAETIARLLAPFAPYTDSTAVPVRAITGWTAS